MRNRSRTLLVIAIVVVVAMALAIHLYGPSIGRAIHGGQQVMLKKVTFLLAGTFAWE